MIKFYHLLVSLSQGRVKFIYFENVPTPINICIKQIVQIQKIKIKL